MKSIYKVPVELDWYSPMYVLVNGNMWDHYRSLEDMGNSPKLTIMPHHANVRLNILARWIKEKEEEMNKISPDTRRVLMRNTSGGSNKFYEIIIMPHPSNSYWQVETRYGKCSGDWENEGGRKNRRTFTTEALAWQYFLRTVSTKEKKGYYWAVNQNHKSLPDPKAKLSKKDTIIQRLMGGSFR